MEERAASPQEPAAAGADGGPGGGADEAGTVAKFDRLAASFSDRDYGDPERYARRRAQVIATLGPRSGPGETLVDLGCGDGMMARPLRTLGFRYRGVDASPGMLETARARNDGVPFELARLEDYTPAEPVDCVICLRAIKYVQDPVAFFAHVRSYTRGKFVLDINLASGPSAPVVRDLRAAGFGNVELRPFFLPQRRWLPPLTHPLLYALERTPALAPLLSRRFGIAFCAAWG